MTYEEFKSAVETLDKRNVNTPLEQWILWWLYRMTNKVQIDDEWYDVSTLEKFYDMLVERGIINE